jgi:hypothetical protein
MKKYLVWILGILLLLSACDLKKPIIPQWDVTLKVPLLNEIYPVLDLVDGENILIDADCLMYLSTMVKWKPHRLAKLRLLQT